MKKHSLLLIAALAGCVPLHPRAIGKDADLLIYPHINQTPKSQAVLPPLSLASIATLNVIPYVEEPMGTFYPISATSGATTSPGSVDQLMVSQASPTIDPNRPILLRGLKPNKKYRVYGRAYNQANSLISLDSRSYVEVVTATDDRPEMTTLPVNLLNTPFAATASILVNTWGRTCDYLKATFYQVNGNVQIATMQTTRNTPEILFGNLQGNTNYRLLVEAYKLGSVVATNSLDIAIGSDTAPPMQTMSLVLPNEGIVTTLAGAAGATGATNGVGSNARFNNPYGITVDGNGNLYIADGNNNAIRMVASNGNVTTLAGGTNGTADGNGLGAKFSYPSGLSKDSWGDLYIADSGNHTIRKLASNGDVTTVAGMSASTGYSDGTGSNAKFANCSNILTAPNGDFYVADTYNHIIRKMTRTGVATTFVGMPGASGSVDGTGSTARFYNPYGIALDTAGNLYVGDNGNHSVRMVTPAGVVSTLAGTLGVPGSVDGTGGSARFNQPYGVAVDSQRNVYVADFENNAIRKVSSSGVVTTLAGTLGAGGSSDGTGATARFIKPTGVAVDSCGNVYVAEWGNSIIRLIQ